MHIYDPDGDLLAEGSATNADAVLRAFDNALGKFCDKESDWRDSFDEAIKDAKEDKKLVVVLFMDDRKASKQTSKEFENRNVAKLHKEFVFVKLMMKDHAELVKQMRVMSAPTILIIDPEDENKTLSKSCGQKSFKQIRDTLKSALSKKKPSEKR